MLQWIDDYFVGSSIKKPEELREKIDSGFFSPDIYLLTLSDNPGNLMEILPAVSLRQKPLKELCPPVVGVAKGKDEAMELACRILEDSYGRTGSFRVEDYLIDR